MNNQQKVVILSDDVLRIFDKYLDFEITMEIARWYHIVNRLDTTINTIELESTNIPEAMKNLELLKQIRDGFKNTSHSRNL